MITIRVEGTKELSNALKQLPMRMRDRVMRNISRVGGRVIVKAARKSVMIPGTLGRQFASEIYVGNDRRNKAGVVVTVKKGRKAREMVSSRGQTYVPATVGMHLIEGYKGRKVRRKKTGASTGIVKKTYPDPIEAGYNIARNDAMSKMMQEADKIIQKELKKLL